MASVAAEVQLECLLSGGDDYELVFTAAPAQRAAVLRQAEPAGAEGPSAEELARLDAEWLQGVETVTGAEALEIAYDVDGQEVKLAFDNHAELIAQPEVDLVVVTVKVPHHFELVQAAIAAGKSVYCEWPLGNGLREAEAMAAMARERGVLARVGLQARSSPVVAYAKQLIADGYIGEVLSSTIVADAINWGADILDCYAYLLDRRNGASMLTIPFGHSLDAFCWTLGEFAELSATFATRRPQVRHVESGQMLACDVADQIVIGGRLACKVSRLRAASSPTSPLPCGGRSASPMIRWAFDGPGPPTATSTT